MGLIAGHEFEGVASDRRCIRKLLSGDVCGKFWDNVKTATNDDIGKPDKAHEPNLTQGEVVIIKAEVEREEKLLAMMVGW